MPDAIPSDHDAIESHRITLDGVGRTSRLQLPLPQALPIGEGEFIRVLVDGHSAHTRVASTLDSRPAIRGAYANKRMARTQEGEDLLGDWLSENGYSAGDTIVLDDVTEGYAVGVRQPGERVVYDPPTAPTDSLSDIAESFSE